MHLSGYAESKNMRSILPLDGSNSIKNQVVFLAR
jgi:hypothetical protein